MTANLMPEGKQSFTDAAGVPLVGGKLWTTVAGTGAGPAGVPLTTWSDPAQTAPNTNPIILDGRGEAVIFWSGIYTIQLRDALDNVIWTIPLATSFAVDAQLRTDLANGLAGPGADLVANKRTAAEIAAAVIPTNYQIPSHDQCGLVYVERYGVAGNAVALANARLVAKTALATLWIRPATYSIANTFVIDLDGFHMHMERGAIISYTGADAGIRVSGASNCKCTGGGNIVCTNIAAMDVDFQPTLTANCLFNVFEFHTVQGAGRGAALATQTNIGIRFDQYNAAGNKIAYWNTVRGRRIIDVNTCVQFDAPNADPANGANANQVENFDFDNYWKGCEYRAIECFASNVSGYGAPGAGADTTYLHYVANGSLYNQAKGGGGEPGLLSSPFLIAAGCNYNDIDLQASNFAGNGTNLGDGNKIATGRDLYRMEVSTGDVLTENTNYRFGKVTMLNTSGGTITLRWRSRNAANGYYTSGVATLLCWNQGGVTVDRLEQTFQESDQAQTSQTRFIGVIVVGNDIFFVFSVRNFGGANATTGIDITVDCLGPETHQTGPTVEAGALTARVSTTIRFDQSVADGGIVKLPNGVEGYGTIFATPETMFFNVQTTGVVTKISGTANTVNTDTAANLCVYDAGTYAEMRNRLGATKILKATFTF